MERRTRKRINKREASSSAGEEEQSNSQATPLEQEGSTDLNQLARF